MSDIECYMSLKGCNGRFIYAKSFTDCCYVANGKSAWDPYALSCQTCPSTEYSREKALDSHLGVPNYPFNVATKQGSMSKL